MARWGGRARPAMQVPSPSVREAASMYGTAVAVFLVILVAALQGSAPAESPFPFHIPLDPEGTLELSWNISYAQETIYFQLLVRELKAGVLFGMSDRGELENADLVVDDVTVADWNEEEIDGGVAEEVVNLNIINATAMSTDELNAAVTRALTAGYTDIKVTLAPDAGVDMFQAIAAPIAATVDPSLESWELVGIGTIDLTISGAKTVPEYVFYGVDYGYTENWAAGPVLRSVTLPDVTEIKNSAFCSCINLISVSAPKCEVIGTNAFLYDESMSSIYFPVAKIIGDGAFGWCESLTEISLPEATTLGNSALGICSNLKTAYLPKVTHINGHDAFYDCKSLVKITLGAIATVNDSNIGTFKDTPTENIDLVLSPEQKAMTYDSSTKIYTAGTEAFDFGNTNEFVGYTFKSITFVGE